MAWDHVRVIHSLLEPRNTFLLHAEPTSRIDMPFCLCRICKVFTTSQAPPFPNPTPRSCLDGRIVHDCTAHAFTTALVFARVPERRLLLVLTHLPLSRCNHFSPAAPLHQFVLSNEQFDAPELKKAPTGAACYKCLRKAAKHSRSMAAAGSPSVGGSSPARSTASTSPPYRASSPYRAHGSPESSVQSDHPFSWAAAQHDKDLLKRVATLEATVAELMSANKKLEIKVASLEYRRAKVKGASVPVRNRPMSPVTKYGGGGSSGLD